MTPRNISSFYDIVSSDAQYRAVLNIGPKTIDNFGELQRLLKFPLRPYQVEAMNAFQLFWKDGFDSRSLRQRTMESVDLGGGKNIEWAKIGFEMATGSGKTLLMGALLMYLWKKGYKDFLIFTPNTILFDKTIENFTPRAEKSVFGDGWSLLSYNLVTGNTYRDKTCNYEPDRDISFYVFNIQKFYEKGGENKKESEDTMKGVPYVRRPLEESLWRDESGQHTISFIDFLRTKRPVIISDEAHHYQQKKTQDAIFELRPSIVLEFTATSAEKGVSDDLGQNNLYKYPMQRYIGEGYGKRIFAVGCGTSEERIIDEVTESDKQKLVWAMLIHLLKREALREVNAPVKKPMILIKSRSIKHSEKVHEYLSGWPQNVGTELSDVLEQVEREQTDLAMILKKHLSLNKKDALVKQLSALAHSVFTIHSENKNDEDVWTDYKTLDDNAAEIVNQVRVFTEGVDYDNFYTIAVLGDSVENAGFAAAQLIGRGLRLYKEKREFDVLEHDLKEQSEILHVICERGRRFDKIVDDIRKKLKLSESTIETLTEEEEKENKIIMDFVDDHILPVLKIRNVATGLSFEDAIKDQSLSVGTFINSICGLSGGEKVIKPEVLAAVEYVEVSAEKLESQTDKPKTTKRTLVVDDKDVAHWAQRFIDDTGPFIGNNSLKTITKIITEIIASGIQVETAYAQDYRKAIRALEKGIIKFYTDGAYNLMFTRKFEIRKEKIKNILKNSKVILRKREGWTNFIYSDQPLTPHLQQKGVVVQGYKYSAKPFVKLDSPPEKWVADKLEHLCSLDKSKQSFWVRNEPQIEYAVEVRPAPFYPDFLSFINGKWAIIDVKGRHLAEAKQIDDRKKALKLLSDEGNIDTYFLVDDVMDRKGFTTQKIDNITDFAGYCALHNENLDLSGFVSGREKTLFDK